MGTVLLGLTSLEVVHTNPPKGHTSFTKGKSWIADMKATNALIGFFRDKKGDRYAMVVNQLRGKNKSAKETADTIELTFDSSVQSVTALNWLDGKPGRLTLDSTGKSSLRIAGGTGVLLKTNAIALASVSAAEGDLLDSGIRPEDVQKRPWLDYVRQCADVLMVHGTDRYGKVRSPMLMNIIDVRTRECPANPKAFDEAWRVARRGRRGPAGGNLYLDQATLAVMRGLTGLTGSKKYADFAHKCANHTMTKLVDRNGLFWWGYHRHYDAYKDRMTGHSGNPHEIHIQQVAWPTLWAINPKAVRNEIDAIWEWHVIDKKTGEINRHADKKRGCDFAMSAGEILLSFAFLHTRAKTRDTVWLDRARLVADYHWTSRRRTTNLIPNRPNAGPKRFDGSHFDTSITGLYCVRLLEAFELTRHAAFRDQAVAYLKAYAKYGWDAKSKMFWGSLKLDGTPVPGPRVSGGGYKVYEPRGAIDLWQPYIAGYEHPLATAQAFAFAADVTRDPVLLDAAKKWARLIRREFPPAAA
jgi:hypothetical protein